MTTIMTMKETDSMEPHAKQRADEQMTQGIDQKTDERAKKRTWDDALIDIFKKLLQTSNFKYGTKKKF